ncbi:MAG TPA: polysaccharide deacetylase family protein [Actinomycetota bacterium]|nr:polysaccharide deacetylase family protein [Actinomycetota bacterium]
MKRVLAGIAGLALLASLLVTAAPTVWAAEPALPPTEWVIGPDARIAVITLDGRPKAKHVSEVLDVLARAREKASFFLPGAWVDHHLAKAKEIVAEGHVLANRGYGSTPLTQLSDEAIASSIARGRASVEAAGGTPAVFLRPPKGARDARVLSVAGSLGYRGVRWSHHPGGGLASKIAAKVVRDARNGMMVSLDIWRKAHRKALPKIIEQLRSKRFGLRTIDALKRAHPIRWDVTLSSGSTGPEVSYLQKRLNATSYPAGEVDGSFGYEALQAVYAFEKVHWLPRDGIVPPEQMSHIAASGRPRAPERAPDAFVDIDISRQVLFEVRDGRVRHTIPISSGNEEYYESEGQTYKAHTPRGDFTIERKIPGWRESDLGMLWYPSYFVGGFAIHGSESVPTYPASHGCVRIPMYATIPFYNRNPIGMPVFVHD